MMDRASILKFGKLFDLVKYLEHTYGVWAYGVRHEL